MSELAGIQQAAGPQVKVDLISACTLDPATSPWESSDASNQVMRGLKGEYFTSPDLSGTPAVTRVDNQVNFDWEQDPIPVSENKDTFSARWTGRIVPSIAGDQVFKICADGGVRLIVDGVTLFDNFDSPPAPDFRPTLAFFAKIPATAGQVLAVELQYHRTPGLDCESWQLRHRGRSFISGTFV